MVKYPAQIDNTTSLPSAVDGATTVSASVVNRLRAAILAIETELGIKPSGVDTTVRNRLDILENSLGTISAVQLGGDIGGTGSNPKIIGLQGRSISSATPSIGSLLSWSGSVWAPSTEVSASEIQSGLFIMDGYAEPDVSESGQGRLYFDSTSNIFKISENGGDYLSLSTKLEITVGPAGSGADYLCDGAADEVQINDAITSANSSGVRSVVKLFPGTYSISAPVILKSNVILAGSGTGATKIVVATDFSNSNYFVIGTLGEETSGTSIALTIDAEQGNNIINLATGSEFNAIEVDEYLMLQSEALWETTNLSGRKVGEFVKVRSKSISTIQIYGMVRDNYKVIDSALVHRMNFVKDCGIRDLEIYQEDDLDTRVGNIPPLVSFQKTRNAFIDNCKLHRNDGPGITVFQSVDISVINCLISDLTDNTAQNRLGYGCLIGGASENIVVKGCKISKVRHGIDCGPSRAPTSPTNNYGIPRGISIVSNVCSHATNAAYSTHSEGENFSFVGNVASNCDSYGFFMRARGCRITSNTIEWCGGGIGIGNSAFDSSGGSASGSHVVGNTIRHIKRLSNLSGSVYALGEGIILALTDNVIVSGNTISDCDAAGIRLRVGTLRCVITRNTILNCNLRNASGDSSEAIVLDSNLNGSAASVASKVGSTITITGATNISSAQIGRSVTISSSNSNNGTFTILSTPSSSSFTFSNALGLAPDAYNGLIQYAIEGSTDNIIENNFASNTAASRYDRDTTGHMKYLIRDYGAAGNLRNTYRSNTGIGMETGLLSVNTNSYQYNNSNTEGFVLKTVSTAPTDSSFISTPQTGTIAFNTTDNKIYTRTSSSNTWRSSFPITDILENIQFNSTVSTPLINQLATAVNSATGQNLQIAAQNASGTTSTGGNLILSAGSGTSNNGVVRIAVNGSTGIQLTPSNSGQNNYNVVSGATSVLFNQSSNTTNSATGSTWTVQAQNATGTTANGGALVLTSGTGTSLAGATRVQVGGTTLIEAAQVVSGQNVVSLARKGNLTSTQMPSNTGDGVVYVANATTAPTANPVSGSILYADGGALKVRNTDGNIASVAADPTINGLRLTLTTGTPVISFDVSSSSTIYFTPYTSGYISLYDGTAWILRNTSEISIALSGLTSGKNYDIFAYWTGSAVALELSSAWTDDTTRANALARQNGILVKSGTTTRRYVGTFRTIDATSTTDTFTQRYLYNWNNQTLRTLYIQDTTASWTYNSATYRQVRNQTANKVELVLGQPANANGHAFLIYNGASGTGVGMFTGIGVDSTSSNSAIPMCELVPGGSVGVQLAQYWLPSHGELDIVLSTGYHALNWLESGHSGGVTGLGTVGSNVAHMRARLLM